MCQSAKIFANGRSQAVRLPAAFRFKEKEVFIRKDETTGDVILSARPENWDRFFALRDKSKVPDDFLSPETRGQGIENRDPFADFPNE